MNEEQKIKFDKRNYRKHSKKNKALIRKSLEELGAGRSVVIDADDTLVAGNGVFEQAQALQMPVRVIETDGSELVVVKRTDIRTTDEKRRKLALADNIASDLSSFDNDLLCADWSRDALKEWGVTLPDTIDYLSITENDVMNAIIYKPSKQPASVSDFVDDKLYNRVKDALKSVEIPQELAAFVEMRLQNFRRIRFDKVADYYARVDERTKLLFRQLALVFDVTGTTFADDVREFYKKGLEQDCYEDEK